MIGDNVKQLRTGYGDSQQELAQKLDISINYLSLIENNRKRPSLKLIEKLAQTYECSIASIVERDPLKSELRQIIDKQGLQKVLNTLQELIEGKE